MIKQWIDRHLDGETKESAMVHEIAELRAALASRDAEIEGWRIGMQADMNVHACMQEEINALKAEIEENESLWALAVKADNGGQP